MSLRVFKLDVPRTEFDEVHLGRYEPQPDGSATAIIRRVQNAHVTSDEAVTIPSVHHTTWVKLWDPSTHLQEEHILEKWATLTGGYQGSLAMANKGG